MKGNNKKLTKLKWYSVVLKNVANRLELTNNFYRGKGIAYITYK